MLDQQASDLETGIAGLQPGRDRLACHAPRQAELKSALKAVQAVPDLVRDLMFG